MNADFYLISGNGGSNAANSAGRGAGGAGGDGGSLSMDIDGTLFVGTKNHKLGLTRGADIAAEGDGGNITFYTNVLDLAEGSIFTVTVENADDYDATAGDLVSFGTVNFNRSAEFWSTNLSVSNARLLYTVGNVYVLGQNNRWRTDGSFQPDSDANWMSFDMTGMREQSNISMLAMQPHNDVYTAGNGVINIADFDPEARQNLFLDNYHNDPAHLEQTPAFLTSAFELKRLDLDTFVLIDRVAGVPAGTHYGEEADDFAYYAGLRRYYWDVYTSAVDPNTGSSQLLADNYKTADASRVYLQAALAPVAGLNETFYSSTARLIDESAQAGLNTPQIALAVGGSPLESLTHGGSIDVNNFSAALSASYKFEHGAGQTAFGIFGEFGFDSYETYSDVADYGQLNGEGDATRFGFGAFLRNDFNQGTWLEASFRGGVIDNGYNLYEVTRLGWQQDGIDDYAFSFDTRNYYVGAHLGVGHNFALSEKLELEIYGRALWTHVFADSYQTGFGEFVQVDAIDSFRTRLGARLSTTLSRGGFQGFFGLAWQYEFMAEATGRIGSQAIGFDEITAAPSLRGSSAFGEVGVVFRPAGSNFGLEARIYGMLGYQRGFGGNLSLSYYF